MHSRTRTASSRTTATRRCPEPRPTAASLGTEAQKTEPDKNTYLVFRTASPAPTRHTTTEPTSCSKGTRRGARRRELHHSHQPRRRRRAPGDAAGDQDATGNPLADDRRLDLGSVREAAALHDGEPHGAHLRRDAELPVDGRGRLRRARPRRLRGNPGRQRRQHLDRRGHRRLEQAGHRRAKRPNSFIYRYVPERPG